MDSRGTSNFPQEFQKSPFPAGEGEGGGIAMNPVYNFKVPEKSLMPPWDHISAGSLTPTSPGGRGRA